MFCTSLKKDLNCRKVKAGRSIKYKREKEKNKMNFFFDSVFFKLRQITEIYWQLEANLGVRETTEHKN